MEDMNVATPLRHALAAKGYEALTAVQAAVLADGVAGRDVLVSAQTGSGKTVAFGLAIAPELLAGNDRLLYADVPGALIIAPTRELALQVARELDWLYAEAGAKIATCVGGMDYRTEKRALERGAHIVVGTPGRLRDHIERRSLDLSGLRAAVLDEADEMLDLGFREDLEFILGAAPVERRTLMFSATVPKEIAALAEDFQKDALRIVAQGEAKQHVDIEYRALSVAVRDREHAIFNLLRFYEARTALVFCKTRANVSHLMARMGNRGFQVVALSGELSQQERTHALQALRDGRARVCIATDVAARGIDLPGLELVVHADLPSNSDTLLHRSGRTGRAGRKGVSALIVAPSEFKKAQRLLQGAKVVAEWGSAPSADDVIAKDDMRMLEHPALVAGAGDDGVMVAALLERFGAEAVAAGFVRMWREGRSAPEVLSDAVGPVASAPPRERSEFGASVWFSVSVGRSGRAEARWLLPKICDAGSIAKDGIGAIRVQEDVTFVQIGAAVADRFGQMMELDKGVIMERLAGEPTMDRPERAFVERVKVDRPRAAAPPAAERREKPAYAPKPARVVEDAPQAEPRKAYDPDEAKPFVKREEAAYAPRAAKPYVKREEGAKPYAPRAAKPYVKREDGEKKPYAPRAAAAGKPYVKREDGEKKPYAPRAAAAGKPYVKREDGEKKPYAARDAKPYVKDGERKPYAPRDAAKPYAPRDGAAKPYVKRDDTDADRKPRWAADPKAGARPVPKSAGFKSFGGAGKPARAEGYKSLAAEGARPDGDAKRTYAPKGDAARPFVKREGAGKAGGFKSHAAEGKKPFARVKPAAPKGDAKDTSKRFVPPKGPKR